MLEGNRRWVLTKVAPGGFALLLAYWAGFHDRKETSLNPELIQVRETLQKYFRPEFIKNIAPDNIFGGDILSSLDKSKFPGNLKTHPLMYDAVVHAESPLLTDAFAPDKDTNGQIAIFLEDNGKTGRMEFQVLSPTQKPSLEILPSLADSVFILPSGLAWETFLESEHDDSLGLKADIAVTTFTQGGLQYRASANVNGSIYMDFMPEPPAVRIQTRP